MREVERIRGIDHHLAVESLTHSLERGQRAAAIGGVDQHLCVKLSVRRKRQVDSSPLLSLPGLLRIPRTDGYLMTCGAEGLSECRSNGTCAQNGNLHGHIIYR